MKFESGFQEIHSKSSLVSQLLLFVSSIGFFSQGDDSTIKHYIQLAVNKLVASIEEYDKMISKFEDDYLIALIFSTKNQYRMSNRPK